MQSLKDSKMQLDQPDEPPPDIRSSSLALASRITGYDIDGSPIPAAKSNAAQLSVVVKRLVDFANAIVQAAREDAAAQWLRRAPVKPAPEVEQTYSEAAWLRALLKDYRAGVACLAEVPEFRAWRALSPKQRKLRLDQLESWALAADDLARKDSADRDGHLEDAAGYRAARDALIAAAPCSDD